jgi:hypothetical protein
VYKYAGGFDSVEQVDIQCGRAGKWEDDCRHAWVAGRMSKSSGISMEDLLVVCGSNADCAFELLDFRPSNEVTVQMERCEKYAGQHVGDCTRHAMQRWYYTKPTARDLVRVSEFPSGHHDKVGYWLAAVVACQGVGECPNDDKAGKFCASTAATFERVPSGCPAATKQPLPHNRGRPKHGGARPPRAPEASRTIPGSAPSGRPPNGAHRGKVKGSPKGASTETRRPGL